MKKIRALIIDDEPLARQRIRHLAREISEIQIIGESSSGTDGIVVIERDTPDLLFLDVQMPEMDGFEMLRKLANKRIPAVIFTTAYDQHAIRAFESHALDYLLKPIQPDRFQAAIARAHEHLENKQASETVRNLLALLDERPKPDAAKTKFLARLTVKTDDKLIVIKTDTIDSIESAGNYIAINAGRETHILRETLNSLETQLDPEQFVRVSRSAIVKLDCIKELQPMFKGEHIIVLQNGKRLTMSRSLFRPVEKALKFH